MTKTEKQLMQQMIQVILQFPDGWERIAAIMDCVYDSGVEMMREGKLQAVHPKIKEFRNFH